jgi:sugar fermentation stimulation protein A
MKYGETCRGVFIERPNRFIAIVDVEGIRIECHVKNTGRCKELLVNGAKVVLERSKKKDRKTDYDLIAVYKGKTIVNIDSQAPNKVVVEKIGTIMGPYDKMIPEYKIGSSRLDVYVESDSSRYLIEVKGVTLEREGMALFPDARTERGVKHIKELIKAVSEGYDAILIFIIQMKGVDRFEPNYEMHYEFGRMLELAHSCGVRVLVYDCVVKEDEISLSDPVPLILGHSYS